MHSSITRLFSKFAAFESYLSFARIYLTKQWGELCVFNDHTALATGVRFGQNAGYLVSASMDRSLKFYA